MKQPFVQLISIAAIASGTLLAQAQPYARRGGPPGDPQQREQQMLDRLATALSLTDAQKTQAKTIFDAELAAATPLRQQLTQGRQALSNAIKAGKTDAEIDSLAASEGVLMGQLTALHTKALTHLYAILTPDQQQKFNNLRGPWGGRMGPPL